MKSDRFSLLPHASGAAPQQLKLQGNIIRKNNIIRIIYELYGDLSDLEIPQTKKKPERKNELWKTTCFEFFLAVEETAEYWEINLSPSGDWNIYSFKKYREGMLQESSFNKLHFNITIAADNLMLHIDCNLDSIINNYQPVNVAICAVIKNKQDALSYWSLLHPESGPDFHNRDTFIITV